MRADNAPAQRIAHAGRRRPRAFYSSRTDTTAHFLASNPRDRIDGGRLALFSIPDANPDGFDHLHGTVQADGSVKLAWEDQTGGGDKDFDDVIMRATSMALPQAARYVYQAHAVDVDGDTLTYSLVDAPAGATLDPMTGNSRGPVHA